MKPAPFEYVAPATRRRGGGRARAARRRRQGAGRRPEPGAHAEPPARAPGACSSTSTACAELDYTPRGRRASSRSARSCASARLERWAADAAAAHRRGAARGRARGHPQPRHGGGQASPTRDPASELPALLLCLDGAVVARGRRRRARDRRRPSSTARRSPPRSRADELVTEVRFTLPPAGRGLGLRRGRAPPRRLRPRGRAPRSCWLDDGGRVAGARLALFGVGRHAACAARRGGGAAHRPRADAGAIARGRARRRRGAVARTATSTPPRATAARWRRCWRSAR